MIAIKGMDMPKSCKDCNGIDDSGYTHYCIFGKFKFSEVETGDFYNKSGYKHPKCPCISISEENKDMSWRS